MCPAGERHTTTRDESFAPHGAHPPQVDQAGWLFPVDPATVGPGQLDGWECAACGRDLLAANDPGIEVGNGLYACRGCITAYHHGLADALHQPGPPPTPE